MLKKILFTFLMACLVFTSKANDLPDYITVGLFVKKNISHVVLTIDIGSYNVIADGKVIYELSDKKALQVKATGDKMALRTWSESIGTCSKLELIRKSWGSCFKLKAKKPEQKQRIYNDNLLVTSEHGRLKMINEVWLEHYVAGVVEAESGTGKSFEYYKAQAILCRTYALRHLNKFIAHGFNLCDNVECQVYKGKNRHDPSIKKAVEATDGLVIVDADINLITAAFHSNSGGQTVNSEEVWSRPVTYLRSKIDSFSLDMPHAKWEKTLLKSKWLAYLKDTFKFNTDDTSILDLVLDYCPSEREEYLDAGTQIPLKKVRAHLKLRSTYFSITEVGEHIVLKGSGFGHGVGLSQEGAMKMASLGYNYTEILHYYYTDIHLVDLAVIDFFKKD